MTLEPMWLFCRHSVYIYLYHCQPHSKVLTYFCVRWMAQPCDGGEANWLSLVGNSTWELQLTHCLTAHMLTKVSLDSFYLTGSSLTFPKAKNLLSFNLIRLGRDLSRPRENIHNRALQVFMTAYHPTKLPDYPSVKTIVAFKSCSRYFKF